MTETLIFNDQIYGQVEIIEPVLIEIIQSEEIQRLKGINQYGLPDHLYHHKKGFSRFTHSVGVTLLLKHLDASLEEQVAGSLHDVSHRTFSHLYDWVMTDHTQPGVKEDLQDQNHINFITSSNIPQILDKFG